jgi:hypothetical protein
MKMIFSAVVIFGVCISCHAEEKNKEIEHIRSVLLKVTPEQKQKIPSNIVAEYLDLIRDDSKSIAEEKINRLFTNIPTTLEQRFQRYALVEVLLFRERDNQKTLNSLFDKLTMEERVTIVGLLSTLEKSFINRDYLPFLLKGFTQAIKDAETIAENRSVSSNKNEILKSTEKQGGADEMAIQWLRLVALTENPDAGPAVKNIIERHVRRTDFRFNLVAIPIAHMGADALPIARWYFEEHAWHPFQIAVVARYLRKYDNPSTSSAYVENKKARLQECMLATNPDYDNGVPGDKPTASKSTKPATSKNEEGKQ